MSTAAAVETRTKVHRSSQLQRALGLDAAGWLMARRCGLVPAADRASGNWSGVLVDELVARRDQIAAGLPDWYDSKRLQTQLGLDSGQWARAQEAGLLPGQDEGQFWSAAAVAAVLADPDGLAGRIPPPPPPPPTAWGVWRSVERLAERTDLAAVPDDMPALLAAGLTEEAGWWKERQLYNVDMLDQAAEDPVKRAVVARIVAEREAWIAGSILVDLAAEQLGWRWQEVRRIAAEQAVRIKGRRIERAAVDGWLADEQLMEQVRLDRLLGPEQSVAHLGLRETEWAYILAAGWVRAVDSVTKHVGRYKEVQIPLYRIGDVEAVLAIPGVDWEAVRAVRPGDPSPLREHVRLPVARADAVRAFCGDLGREWGVEVWPRWHNGSDTWLIDWDRLDGHPTEQEVAAALAAHPDAAAHASRIELSTPSGGITGWARSMLKPGAAVVVDTETTFM